MTLGQKVRQARIRAGLTQEQAAGGRITRNMLSLIENDLSAPSMKTLEYLAAALGVTAGWLLADDASDEAAERLPRARAMLREGDHRGCAALLEPGAEQALDEELLLLAVSAMELAEQALGAEQYEEAARRAEQALRWNARGLSVFSVSFTITSPELKQYKKHAEIIEALQSLEYVHYIEEMN